MEHAATMDLDQLSELDSDERFPSGQAAEEIGQE
jgi:hypothetical protein